MPPAPQKGAKGPKMVPKGPQNGAQRAPKWCPKGPLGAQRAPKGPKGHPRVSKGDFWEGLEPPKGGPHGQLEGIFSKGFNVLKSAAYRRELGKVCLIQATSS